MNAETEHHSRGPESHDCAGCTALDVFGKEVFKKISENTELTAKIYESLTGDLEKKGLRTRVDNCETRLDTIEAVNSEIRIGKVETKTNMLNGALTWLLGVLSIGVLGFIGGLLTGAIKVTFN